MKSLAEIAGPVAAELALAPSPQAAIDARVREARRARAKVRQAEGAVKRARRAKRKAARKARRRGR